MSFYLSIMRNKSFVAVDLQWKERLVFRPVHSTP